jgi:hypothetical protein
MVVGLAFAFGHPTVDPYAARSAVSFTRLIWRFLKMNRCERARYGALLLGGLLVSGCSHAGPTADTESDAGLPWACEAFVRTLGACLNAEQTGHGASSPNVAAVRTQLLAARRTVTADLLRTQCDDAAAALQRSCR